MSATCSGCGCGLATNEHYVRSTRQDWRTPLDLASDVRLMWDGIALDPCCTENNLRAERFYTEEDDGLVLPWEDRTWCNPPFSAVRFWVPKVLEEAAKGYRIGLYLSATRTETECLQDAIAQTSCFQFLRGKQKHWSDRGAMVANVIYWFNVPPEGVHEHLGWRGLVCEVWK